MSLSTSVEQYVSRQPGYAWRRTLLRGLIRTVGFHLLTRTRVYGEENLPPSGPAIVMMNHTSLIDPVLIMGAVRPRFVIPMSKIENMRNPLLAPFIGWWGAYYINRGEIDRKALLNSIELVRSGQIILIAPEGTRQRDGLARPKDGLAYVATKANAVIIPTGITGAQPWLTRLKRLNPAPVTVTFGKPFRFKTRDGERVPREALSAMSDEAMYQLALTLPEGELRGEYHDVSQATTEYLEFV